MFSVSLDKYWTYTGQVLDKYWTYTLPICCLYAVYNDAILWQYRSSNMLTAYIAQSKTPIRDTNFYFTAVFQVEALCRINYKDIA